MSTAGIISLAGVYLFCVWVWVMGVGMYVADAESRRWFGAAQSRARWVWLAPVWPLGVLLLLIPLARLLAFAMQLFWAVWRVALGKQNTLDG